MFWKLPSNKVLLFGFLFIIGLGAAFYFFLAKNAEKAVKQTLLQRQQLLVRAEVSNLISFFQVFGDSIAVLSRLPTIEKLDATTAKDLDIFVEQWRDSGIVSGIVLTDSEGLVKFNSNVEGTHDVGASLADRDYFLWAKNEPENLEYFVGKPVVSRLGASKGGMIVPVASTIYRNGVLKGLLVASVRLDSLTKHYLELMKISDTAELYLFNEMGETIYKNTVKHPLSDDKVFSSQLKSILNEKKDGKLETDEHLLAYTKIQLGEQNWLLVMATPTNETTTFTVPIFTRLIIMALLVSVTILFYGLVSTEVTRRGYDNSRI